MLSSFRSFNSGIGAKLLLAVLIVAFAIWGVGDIATSPSRNTNVATVGRIHISQETFQRALRNELEQMRQMLGDRYSPEIVKAFHPERKVIQSLTQQALIQQEAETLGLVPSDADVARRIRKASAFQDNKGNFDKNAFERFLRTRNLSEQAYVSRLRQDIASNLLLSTVASVPVKPFDIAAKTLASAREEQRMTTLYTFSDAVVGPIAAPDQSTLDAFYSTHTREFSAPELRSVSYIAIRPEDVQSKVKVTEDDLLNAYKERIDEFKRPERRLVEQLLYATEMDAQAAYDALKSGKSFEAIAKSTNITNKGSLSLGKVERSAVLENAADSVFSTEPGQFTTPIKSLFGWHVFRVREVEAAGVVPLSEVRHVIERDVKQRIIDEEQNALVNALEDTLAGGATLDVAAKELKLKKESFGPVTQSGKTPGGTTAKLPELHAFLEIIFKTEANTSSSLVRSPGGIFYVVHVDLVTPERERPLAEVREAVVAAWKKDEQAKRFQDMAQDISVKMADTTSRAQIISRYALRAAYHGPLKRTTDKVGGLDLPSALVNSVFTKKPNESTNSYALPNGHHAVAVVGNRIETTNISDAQIQEIRTTAEQNARNEIIDSYLAYLEKKYTVSVNEKLLISSEQ